MTYFYVKTLLSVCATRTEKEMGVREHQGWEKTATTVTCDLCKSPNDQTAENNFPHFRYK